MGIAVRSADCAHGPFTYIPVVGTSAHGYRIGSGSRPYKGSFGGRVFPLWRDSVATVPNVRPKFLSILAKKYGSTVTSEDVVAYIAAIAAHPAFTVRFQDDLSTPGLHIPLTEKRHTFSEVAELGRTIIWLHTFGERMTDEEKGRLAEPPRLPLARRPRIPEEGAIPQILTQCPTL